MTAEPYTFDEFEYLLLNHKLIPFKDFSSMDDQWYYMVSRQKHQYVTTHAWSDWYWNIELFLLEKTGNFYDGEYRTSKRLEKIGTNLIRDEDLSEEILLALHSLKDAAKVLDTLTYRNEESHQVQYKFVMFLKEIECQP